MRSLCYLLLKKLNGEPVFQGGPLQQRVWFVMSMLAVGCGGEIKFQRYDECVDSAVQAGAHLTVLLTELGNRYGTQNHLYCKPASLLTARTLSITTTSRYSLLYQTLVSEQILLFLLACSSIV